MKLGASGVLMEVLYKCVTFQIVWSNRIPLASFVDCSVSLKNYPKLIFVAKNRIFQLFFPFIDRNFVHSLFLLMVLIRVVYLIGSYFFSIHCYPIFNAKHFVIDPKDFPWLLHSLTARNISFGEKSHRKDFLLWEFSWPPPKQTNFCLA